MNGIPSIGVNMYIEGTEEWENEQADVLSGKCIDVDYLNYTPELRDTPKVQSRGVEDVKQKAVHMEALKVREDKIR